MLIRFAFPWVLLALPPVLFLLWDSARRGASRRPSLGYSDLGLVEAAGRTRPAWESHLPLALASLSLSLLLLGLARPQAPSGTGARTEEGLDIVLCLDTSPSMNTPDVQPTRMDAARAVSTRFVQGRPGDRIGVVVFGGIPLTQCPLTVDNEALLAWLEGVRVGMTHTENTALGDGLVTAVNRLKDVPGRGKVVILVTDGRSNTGEVDPLTAARLAIRFGVRVHTVGVGAAAGSPADAELDEGTLREVAAVTGGRYFRATDAGSLERIYAEIDGMERRVTSRRVVYARELYPWFVGAGVAVLGLLLLLEHTLFQEVP